MNKKEVIYWFGFYFLAVAILSGIISINNGITMFETIAIFGLLCIIGIPLSLIPLLILDSIQDFRKQSKIKKGC